MFRYSVLSGLILNAVALSVRTPKRREPASSEWSMFVLSVRPNLCNGQIRAARFAYIEFERLSFFGGSIASSLKTSRASSVTLLPIKTFSGTSLGMWP